MIIDVPTDGLTAVCSQLFDPSNKKVVFFCVDWPTADMATITDNAPGLAL